MAIIPRRFSGEQHPKPVRWYSLVQELFLILENSYPTQKVILPISSLLPSP